jgi:hypothetical protein
MPATVERTVYRFDELSDHARAEATQRITLDAWEIADSFREAFTPGWYMHESIPAWFSLDVDTHNNTYGNTISRPAIHCEIDAWGNCDVTATGTIDLPAFMKARKVAGKCRTAYNQAQAGDLTARTIQDRRTGMDYPELDLGYIDDELTQHVDLSALVESTVQDMFHAWSKALAGEVEYQYSEDAARENVEANDYWFDESGRLTDGPE